MSRCFPFPPPGYEKKAKTDDADALTKEKLKEKKHKKEKKDKEKKEKKDKEKREKKDKEKKEKDKERENKDKHREKKDRKEKHRDKKKEKDRDNDKNRISNEKRIEGRPDGYNGEKLGQSSQEVEEIKNSKFVQELGRRIRDEERGTGIQLAENFTGKDQRRAEGKGRMVEKDANNGAEGKEHNKEKKGNDRREDGQRNGDDERGKENARFQNFARMDQQRVEGMVRPMGKDAEKRLERKEKNKVKEGDNKRLDKHKDKDREKKSKAKDKDREKEKEKVKEKSDHKNRDLVKVKESGQDPIDSVNIKPSQFSKESNKSFAADGNIRKRKELEMNGFLHESDIRPNKLPRPASSSHQLAENGKKLEPCQTAIQLSSDRLGVSNNNKVGNKEHKVNGVLEAHPTTVCSTEPLFTRAQAVENGEASTKPPHPDAKYLTQILSVPKMEEWSDFDDQEWLFSSDNLHSKKPKVGSSGVDETTHVWSEALQIESADVCALPYVIPY